MLLSEAIRQFILEREVARYSPHTIFDYNVTFKKLLNSLGDVEISSIDKQDVISFMASQIGIKAKTLRNYHANLSALWRWSTEQGYCNENILSQVKPPIAEKKVIIPLSKEEIQAIILSALDSDNHLRNYAIVLLLLDTGIRSSELCGLKNCDLNRATNHIVVFGKGRKERQIPISQFTLDRINSYLNTRGKVNQTDPLFLSNSNTKLSRDRLYRIISQLGIKSGVNRVYPHLFRHTFAIQFLRNGGTIYTLQQILGHTTLDMVKRYLAIAQIDLDRDHSKASPVICWQLSDSVV